MPDRDRKVTLVELTSTTFLAPDQIKVFLNGTLLENGSDVTLYGSPFPGFFINEVLSTHVEAHLHWDSDSQTIQVWIGTQDRSTTGAIIMRGGA